MRLLLDSNIIISGLLSPKGVPGKLVRAWLDGRFELVTSEEQIDELQRALEYRHVRERVSVERARDFIKNMDALAIMAGDLPTLEISIDPDYNIILATAVAGDADAIVSGDKRDMLSLREVDGIPIVTAREAVKQLGLEET